MSGLDQGTDDRKGISRFLWKPLIWILSAKWLLRESKFSLPLTAELAPEMEFEGGSGDQSY